jgi:hypothetical protein
MMPSKLLLLLSAAALLAGCVSSGPEEPETVRVQTWSTQTTFGENGPETTRTYTDEERIIERGPEWPFRGTYWLKDSGDRECFMEFIAARADNGQYKLRLRPDCANGMKHIAAWNFTGTSVELYDAFGARLGRYDRASASTRRFTGNIRLTTGTSYPATLWKTD